MPAAIVRVWHGLGGRRGVHQPQGRSRSRRRGPRAAPLLFDQPRAIAGTAPGTREETAVHLQVAYVVPVGKKHAGGGVRRPELLHREAVGGHRHHLRRRATRTTRPPSRARTSRSRKRRRRASTSAPMSATTSPGTSASAASSVSRRQGDVLARRRRCRRRHGRRRRAPALLSRGCIGAPAAGRTSTVVVLRRARVRIRTASDWRLRGGTPLLRDLTRHHADTTLSRWVRPRLAPLALGLFLAPLGAVLAGAGCARARPRAAGVGCRRRRHRRVLGPADRVDGAHRRRCACARASRTR